MFTKDFYSVIDGELTNLVEKYRGDEYIQKHKGAKNNQKSYALLIWFLEFYGKRQNYKDYITDGDNDSSCDIVFDNINNQGERVFYIVQSKWNSESNSEKETNRDEILKALNEFETLLRGEKYHVNEKLQVKLAELDKHRKNNGEVKFIFLSLSHYKGGADDNIRGFEKQDEKIQCEVIDINRIKLDYIDRVYKQIKVTNPLEFYRNPEETTIILNIVQENGHIKIASPFKASVVLLRPQVIYELFDTYSFALFHKNIRNPLLESQFNAEIEKTALDNAPYFWYYNNGITAITSLLPAINNTAKKIKLTGLQIINGAQTVYAIYHAYKNAKPAKRRIMNSEIFITLRLISSHSADFNLNVTRYTNSQNPVDDRDFCANDEIQIRLQNESFNTNVWYEKRRGEFREVPENVEVIPNPSFIIAYLAYYLQDPISVLKNNNYFNETGKELFFISYKEHKEGLYEKIFNEKTEFEDMLCSFYIYYISIKTSKISYDEMNRSHFFHILALFKIAFTKYLKVKRGGEINVKKHIIKMYEQQEMETILQTLKFVNNFILKKTFMADNEEKTKEMFNNFILKNFHYEKVKEELEKLEISVNDIESIVLEKIEE